MKRLFNKHNPISRVVALWLVFVMMAVPFFSNSGLLSNPKANGGSGTPATTATESANINETLLEKTDAGIQLKTGSYGNGKLYYYGVSSVIVSTDEVTLYKDSNVVEEFVYEDTDGNKYTISSADMKLAMLENDVEPTMVLPGDSNLLADTLEVPVAGRYGVYVKVSAIDENGTEGSSGNYCLVSDGVFISKEPFDGLSAKLVDSSINGADVTDSEWYKETYIAFNPSGKTDLIANYGGVTTGEFKYGYAKGDEAIVWKNVSADFGDSNTEQKVEFDPDCEGEYGVYLGYFAGDTLIKQSDKIGDVNIDTKAPVINEATGLYYNPNGWNNANQNYTDRNVEKVDDVKVLRDSSDKSKYRYFVVVDDNGRGIPVTTNLNGDTITDNVKIYDNGSPQSFTFKPVNNKTNVFYADADVLSSGSVVSYKAQVSDGIYDSALSAELPYLEQLDDTKCDIELTWGSSSPGATIPSGGVGSIVDDDKYTLFFETETYNKVNRVVIYGYVNNGTDAYDIYTENNNSSETPEAYYTFDGSIMIPKDDVTDNMKYTELKVHVYLNGSSGEICEEFNLATEYLYDNTDPVLKDASDNSEYSIPTTWNPTEDEIKIDILSGEAWSAESELVTAYYKFDNSNSATTYPFTIVDGKVDDGAIAIGDIPESVDATGTPIYLYAEDAAGNKTNATVYYKKDTVPPVFDTITPLYFSKDNGTTKLSSDVIVNKDYAIYANVLDAMGVKNVTYVLCDTSYVELKSVLIENSTDGCKLSDLIPQEKEDGAYKVKVIAEDVAGLKSQSWIDFTLDTTDPYMPPYSNGDLFWPILQVYDVATDTWLDITDGEERETVYGQWGPMEKDIYYLDGSKQYRYMVKVADVGGVSDNPEEVIKLKSSSPGTVDTTTPVVEENGVKTFYIDINTGTGGVNAYYYKTIDFSINDIAGNTKDDAYAYWGLKLINKDIIVNATLYEKIDGELTAVSLTDALKEELAKGTNKPYCIVVDVSSACSIKGTSIELYYDSNGIPTPITGLDYNNEMNNNPDEDDNTGRYHYYKIYDLEGSTNISYKNLKVWAEDDDSQSAELDLLSILYDITDPVLYDDDSKTTYLTLPTTWVASFSEGVYVIPGTDVTVESQLDKVIYTFAGDTNEYLVQISDDGKEAEGNVVTPANFSSTTTDGTVVTVYAKDKAGNSTTMTYTVKVDAKAPTVDSIAVAGNPNITASDAPLKAAPTITAKVTDNLTVDYIKMTVTYPDGTVKEQTFDYAEGVDAEVNGAAKEISYTIPKLATTDANIPDGTYRVQVKAVDIVGNEVNSEVKSFRVDTTKPVVTAKINSGTVSTKDSYYYKSNVVVALTYNDVNANIPSIVVTDNGTSVNVNWSTSPDANGNYTATYTASTEGVHAIKIIAKDAATNDAVPYEVEFKIDKTLPTLSTTVNGLAYTDNTGMLYMTNNVTLNASVNDTNEDREDLNYQLILTKPDQETVTNLYQKTSGRSFTYTEEGEYTINLFAVDKANNQSSIRSVRFRLDKAAPNLSINGVGSGSSADSVTVSCVMQESFWRDAEGTITIYSRAGDGVPEVLLKTINVTPTSASTVISETFTETGVYRIEFTASDRAGHTSETSTQFTIDRESPVVTLEGPENYAKTKDAIPIAITVADDFYLQKKISLVATRTDDAGKVHNLDFGTWNEGGNPTNIAGTFEEDGIYDISVTATDMAGNSDSKSVHFTIDKSAPVIGDLSYLDDQILTSFSWEEDLDELVSDLTVCDVQMYLNGSVYDGESEIEDGAYTLLIVAKDELGNKTEKEVTFVLDTKMPVFIVTGVEEDEVKNEEYSISVSLQLEEDTLTSVTLNGKEMYSGDNNVCSFTVSEKGEYKLVMSATDAAGNTASYELEFKYGEDSMWWLWLIIAIAVLLVSGIIIFILKKKSEDK